MLLLISNNMEMNKKPDLSIFLNQYPVQIRIWNARVLKLVKYFLCIIKALFVPSMSEIYLFEFLKIHFIIKMRPHFLSIDLAQRKQFKI